MASSFPVLSITALGDRLSILPLFLLFARDCQGLSKTGGRAARTAWIQIQCCKFDLDIFKSCDQTTLLLGRNIQSFPPILIKNENNTF